MLPRVLRDYQDGVRNQSKKLNVTEFFNRSSRRKRGMASNPHFIICTILFFCIFQMNLAMATLGLKEKGKFLWEGREKVLTCWLSQFSFAKVRQLTG